MSELQLLIDQIAFARKYTLRLLDTIDPARWFWQPREGVTHVAWQVGHLAMANYRLGLDRIRGQRPEDEALISTAFLTKFGRDSVSDPNPDRNFKPAELRTVFDRVHQQLLTELPQLAPAELDQPPLKPHSLASTKRACLSWCAEHEMVHAGQIGLLRRLMGNAPLW
jgi:hypothetical protein